MVAARISLTWLHRFAPDLVIKPKASGKYLTLDNVYFCIYEFRNIKPEAPDINTFALKISQFHKNSTRKDKDAKFGFAIPT